MVIIEQEYGISGGGNGRLQCDKCQARSEPIEFWNISPLNYASPAGWTDYPIERRTQRGRNAVIYTISGNQCPQCTEGVTRE